MLHLVLGHTENKYNLIEPQIFATFTFHFSVDSLHRCGLQGGPRCKCNGPGVKSLRPVNFQRKLNQSHVVVADHLMYRGNTKIKFPLLMG